MTDTMAASSHITSEVTSWPDVTAGFGSRGEWALKVNGHEIGHLHGDSVAHFFFPKPLWRELKAAGRIEHHPVFPDAKGPAARRIRSATDVEDVIAMMRLNYERLIRSRQPQAASNTTRLRPSRFAR